MKKLLLGLLVIVLAGGAFHFFWDRKEPAPVADTTNTEYIEVPFAVDGEDERSYLSDLLQEKGLETIEKVAYDSYDALFEEGIETREDGRSFKKGTEQEFVGSHVSQSNPKRWYGYFAK
ncbi:hypothetical protein NRIC_27920 [Enterococcus florum]|uniref:Uncharacterized protein n=1 Tax=Enterococcus florum TaxID=2480627 RepID=A0A4P5PEW9_9ENTE|nr:hypothetical protein [Enterococcus florum]GCF94901.1 hypothetical protein NRIC_27920 [Enterococcus florum]